MRRLLRALAFVSFAGCAGILGLDEVDTLPDVPFGPEDGIDASRPVVDSSSPETSIDAGPDADADR